MYSNELSFIITTIAPPTVQNVFSHIKQKVSIPPYPGGTESDDIVTKNLAHITLKIGFLLHPEITIEKVMQKIDAISFPPIQITAKKHSVYDTKDLGKILVLLIEKNPELDRLHMDIQEALDGMIENKDKTFIWEKENYTPHMSVIYEMKDEDERDAISLVKEILPVTFELTNFLFLGNNPGVRHTRKIIKEYYAKN